ncbi:hypothetical protein [Streptomyces platensis]|uniref:hypothetical protein n=1 Tax=Streptomyces platensis TaxID=58346 RepID=UPI001F45394C|nr:hypothetical protein [Streptomyces platensis]MCF3142525.1 hypothetical protein [Streptomyces platensis]
MGTVVAIGEGMKTSGFALVGVMVRPAEAPESVRAVWQGLPDDVALVILTSAAAAALGPDVLNAARPLMVVMPP